MTIIVFQVSSITIVSTMRPKPELNFLYSFNNAKRTVLPFLNHYCMKYCWKVAAATITIELNHYHIIDLYVHGRTCAYFLCISLIFSVQWTPCFESKNVGGKIENLISFFIFRKFWWLFFQCISLSSTNVVAAWIWYWWQGTWQSFCTL